MIKKTLFSLLLATTTVFGATKKNCAQSMPTEDTRHWFVDANIGYFYPFSHTLREVIAGSVDYQLQLTYKWSKHWGAFVGGDFFYNTGHSTGDHAKTTLWILPITIGIKAFGTLWATNDFSQVVQGYVLLGPRWNYIHSSNNSPNVDHHTNGQGFGGMGGLGLSYLVHQFTVNAIVNFSFANLHAHSDKHNVKAPNTQVGGMVIGGGIGWNY
jgi:hypothetical protein